MEIAERAKPAHRDGGGLRDFEQPGGHLEIPNSARGSAPQARTILFRECKSKFEARRAGKEFCCAACRRFNNRRMTRGVDIYDLAMQWRDDRADPAGLTLLCRLLAKFKDEDVRAGRSWNRTASVVRDKPYLAAAVLDANVAGARRSVRR
jgi:hypothetical protein